MNSQSFFTATEFFHLEVNDVAVFMHTKVESPKHKTLDVEFWRYNFLHSA